MNHHQVLCCLNDFRVISIDVVTNTNYFSYETELFRVDGKREFNVFVTVSVRILVP